MSTQEEQVQEEHTEEEKQMLAKYGKLPKKNDLQKKILRKHLVPDGQKKFDSADWELDKQTLTKNQE